MFWVLEVDAGPLTSVEFYQIFYSEFAFHVTKLLLNLESIKNDLAIYVKTHTEGISIEIEVELSEI